MKTTIIIPSLGRAIILGETLRRIKNQTKVPHQVMVVVAAQEDLPDDVPDFVTVVFSEKGLCIQRNTGIEHCEADVDTILFIDDDTFLHPSYIQEMEGLFAENMEIVGVSGNLLRNGDISIKEADGLLLNYSPVSIPELVDAGLYGCNFGVRRSMMADIRFDERLVLYGWLEDADFSMRLRRLGSIKYSSSLVCVHLMHPSGGRSNHVRFGFSQVMNPFYLFQKNGKSFPFSEVLTRHWLRGVGGNLIGILIGSDRKMRWDRFKGNMVAFRLLLAGHIEPEHAAKL